MLLILNEVEGMYVFNILFLVFVLYKYILKGFVKIRGRNIYLYKFIFMSVLSDIDGPQKSKIKIYSKSHATP
jgi:hypothetical protein